jgi:PAS domain S-box-containing protein
MSAGSSKPCISCLQVRVRRLIVLLTLIVGLTISFAAAFSMKTKRDRDLALRFDRAAAERFTAIVDRWNRALEKIQTAAMYVNSCNRLDIQDFTTFTGDILGLDHQNAVAVQWVNRKQCEIPADADSADEARDADARSPQWAARPECRAAMIRSCDGASVAITPPLSDIATGSKAVVIVCVPIYSRNMPLPPPERRRDLLSGYVIGFIQADDIVVAALKSLNPSGIDFEVHDVTADGTIAVLSRHPSRTRTPEDRQAQMATWSPDTRYFHRTSRFSFGDRTYETEFMVAPDFYQSHPYWHLVLVMGGGAALTLLLALFLESVTKRNEYIRRLVAQRTDELDIVNRKLQTTSAVQSAILDSANVAIISSDTQGVIQTFNAGAERLLGYAASEIVGICTTVIFHKPEEIKLRAELLSKGLGFHVAPGFEAFVARARFSAGDAYEWTYVRKDKSTFPVLLSVSAIRNESGHVTGYLGIAHDLTERRKAEEDLRKLWRAVEQSPATVVITNTMGAIEYVNPKFEETTGYTSAEVFGQNPRILKSNGQEPHFYADMWNTLTGGQVWKGEFCNRKKNGELYWEAASIAPIRNAHGVVTNYVAIKEDITQRRKDAEDLRLALDAAQQANHAKSTILANVSHELRTPLNGVIGMSELLLGTTLDHKQRQFADACHNSATALLALINDILDFSKIEAGKMELSPHEFDLERMVHQSVTMIAPRAFEKGLELDVSIAPELCIRAFGDGERLRQILVNLLSNAVKFTRSGRVSVGLTVQSRNEQNMLIRCAVTDTGIGIPEELLKYLFLPFSQLDSSTTRRFGGTGLGLAISRSLATAMGGEMGIDTAEGRGSTFWFTASLRATPSQAKTRNSTTADIRDMRVLVVDGNRERCKNLDAHLSLWGLNHDSASDFAVARDLLLRASAEGKPYSIACVDGDADSPQLFAFLEWMQVKFGASAPQSLLFTPLGQEPELETMARLNIADCLNKPLFPFMLFRAFTEIQKNCPHACAIASSPREGALSIPQVPKKTGHILIAEDNPVNQLVAVEMLRRAGYTCDVVNNGAQAIEAIRNKSYALVLMDGQMPGLDGYEATRHIREAERHCGGLKHIPIFALTASAVKGDRERCLAAGMDDYIPKPFESHTLIAKVQEALANSRPSIAPAESPAHPSAIAALPASAPIDAHDLLSRCMGDISFLSQMLDVFVCESAKSLDRLFTALGRGDSQMIASDAHALKGAAGSVGALRLHTIASHVENLGLAGDLGSLDTELKRLRDEVERCVTSVPTLVTDLRGKTRAELVKNSRSNQS